MPDFITQYALRRLFTQLRYPKQAGLSRLADDDTEDPDSGYSIDAPDFIPRGCIKCNPPGYPVIDVLNRN